MKWKQLGTKGRCISYQYISKQYERRWCKTYEEYVVFFIFFICSHRPSSITPVLKDLHWLPVSFRIEFKIMLITYKALHDRGPIYIQELLQLYTPSRNLRSSNRNLLVKPYFNLNSYGKRAFSVAAPELWNNLPEDIKSANSIDDFKRKLKTFLFMRAYESWCFYLLSDFLSIVYIYLFCS